MSDDQMRETPTKKHKKKAAKLILLAAQHQLRGMRTAGLAGRSGADRGARGLPLDERVRALTAEINRRWPGR